MPSKQPKELWKHSSLCPATWSSFLFVRRKLLFSGWWIRPRYSGTDKEKEKRTALSAVRFSFALSEFSEWAIPLSKSPVSEIFQKNQKRRRQDVVYQYILSGLYYDNEKLKRMPEGMPPTSAFCFCRYALSDGEIVGVERTPWCRQEFDLLTKVANTSVLW